MRTLREPSRPCSSLHPESGFFRMTRDLLPLVIRPCINHRRLWLVPLALVIGLIAIACRSEPAEQTVESAVATRGEDGDADERALRGPYPGHVKAIRVEQPVAEPGRWRRFRTHKFDQGLTPEQREEIEKLESIGYATASRRLSDGGGVDLYDTERVLPGYNFYTSGHGSEAVLMDMRGRILHRWGVDFWDVWPDYPVDPQHPTIDYWRRAHLFENGDILAIFDYLGLVKLDSESNLIWANPLRSHHDMQVADNGDIYVLASEAHIVSEVNPNRPILEDFVVVLDSSGVEKKRISLLDSVRNSSFEELWNETLRIGRGDVFHTNTLEILDGRIADVDPAFKAGNVLVYMLGIRAAAVLNLESGMIVWSLRYPGRNMHDPKVLGDGHMLIFQNFGLSRESRVIEFDPSTAGTLWEYEGSESVPFYSETCGSAERLENGNTLITESDNGRAFEVTRDSEIVWQFHNPHRAGDNGEYMATLFEVIRLPDDFPLDWVGGPTSP